MPTTFESLRDAIVARINTVPNIGDKVQSRERWADTLTDFQALFKDSTTGGIKGFTVSWTDNKNEVPDYAAMGQAAWQYEFVVRCYMSFQDAANSEDTFDVLLEGIRDSLVNQRTFGVSGVVPFSTEVEILRHGKRMFAGTLCHYAEVCVYVVYVEDLVWA